MKRTLCTSVFLTVLILSIASCSSDTEPHQPADTTSTAAAAVTEAGTVLRENTPDTLPSDLSFGGADVRIAAGGGEDIKMYEIGIDEAEGEIVIDALYDRNRKVEERLDVNLTHIYGNTLTYEFKNEIRNVLIAGDDAYDIIITHQSFGLPHALEGLYHNLSDAPYLDYDQPWWNVDYMSQIEISDHARFLLGGDICVFLLRNMGSMFFNKTLYESHFGNPDALYQLALDGNWTMDQLAKMSTEVFSDINQDNRADLGDTVGLYTATVSTADLFAYSAGLTLTERDADGYPVLVDDQSRNVDIMEGLKKLYFETPGVYVTPDPNDILSTGVETFASGSVLFFPERFSRLHALRDMSDPYGILPYPKADEQQAEYRTMIHDYATLYAVPITLEDIDMPCAVLEAMCAENYRSVIPTYYEVALKVKFTHDNISAQVIDLIRDGASTDFMYANNYYFSNAQLGIIQRDIMTNQKEYMSTYTSMEKTARKLLEELVDQYRNS